jgi:hypothetical protein
MNSALNNISSDLQEALKIDAAKDAQIADLQKQISDLKSSSKTVTISGIQAVQPEILYYEARSANAPRTGPHGIVTLALGEPTVADFRPVVVQTPDGVRHSDNAYLLSRKYPTLTQAQKDIMELATQFSVGCDVGLNPLSSVQDFEWDYQIRKSNGVLINVGLQLHPEGSGWQLRGFDYVSKKWVPLGAYATPVAGKSNTISVSATCDGLLVKFTAVKIDGKDVPVSFSHPITMDKLNAPYCNCAYQLDATADAKPYKATVGNFQISFS